MRKFLAALLTVLMLAAMIVPTAAAAEPTIGVDGSVAADANGLDLVITEYLSDSSSTGVEKIQDKDTAPTTYNAFNYIELYNRGADEIDLYSLSICRSYVDTTTTGVKDWADDQSFDLKIKLNPGSIYSDYALTDARDTTAPCANPSNAYLAPGEFAIIWFWNDRTVTVAQRWIADGKDFGGDGVEPEAPGFSAHYASVTGKQIPEDTLILSVYAGSVVKDTKPTFDLTSGTNCMYGLVDDPDNDFDPKGSPIYTYNASANTYTFNPRVKLLWSWGTGNEVGILAQENKATAFVPANGVPVLYNRDKFRQLDEDEQDDFVPANDYVEIEHADSYRQSAVISFLETPTPGAMESWQWALVDANRVPTGAGNANVTGYVADVSGDWKTPVLNAFALSRYPDLDPEPESDEEEHEVNLMTKEEIIAMLESNPNLTTREKQYVLTTWGLVLIIVGSVIGAAGIAVLVIILIKKKKKPVAFDDVAAEGDVEVIDETAEAAAEEATEETTEE